MSLPFMYVFLKNANTVHRRSDDMIWKKCLCLFLAFLTIGLIFWYCWKDEETEDFNRGMLVDRKWMEAVV